MGNNNDMNLEDPNMQSVISFKKTNNDDNSSKNINNFSQTAPLNYNFKKNNDNDDFTNFNNPQAQPNTIENLQNDLMDIDFLGVDSSKKNNNMISDKNDVFMMEKELFNDQAQIEPSDANFTSNQIYTPSNQSIPNHNILKLNSLQDFNHSSPRFDIDRTSLHPRIRTEKNSEVQESQSPKSTSKKDPFEIINRTNFLDFDDLL